MLNIFDSIFNKKNNDPANFCGVFDFSKDENKEAKMEDYLIDAFADTGKSPLGRMEGVVECEEVAKTYHDQEVERMAC